MAYFFVVENYMGQLRVSKTEQERRKLHVGKLSFEVLRYEITEAQYKLSLNELNDLANAGKLDLYRVVQQENSGFWYTLGLEPGSSLEKIVEKWRELAKLHHPDVGGSPRIFIKMRQAYEAAVRWWKGKEASQ